MNLKASKRGKSEVVNKNSNKVVESEPYDPNAIKDWGDKVSQKEISQKAFGLIKGEALEQKKRELVNKRDTSELLKEDKKKFGSKANQKMEDNISKQKKDERALSRGSKEDNQSARNSHSTL